MMETLVQGNDWLTWIEQFEHDDRSASARLAPSQSQLRASHDEAWNQTDRLFHFPARQRSCEPHWQRDRARWLEEHDVHTQFLDAGIGACWFAQQGDDEPVCGETEEAAIARLARENGLPWQES
jgi:hypothetical protein